MIDELKAKIPEMPPQTAGLVTYHLAGLEEALKGLAQAGHALKVEWASPEMGILQFPKWIYPPKDSIQAPKTIESSEEEAVLLQEGWTLVP